MSMPMAGAAAGSLDDLGREYLEGPEDEARAYLRQWWLASAMEALVAARRHAGLTQKQVAERLRRQQPAIARLERDDAGRTTLHAYVDYALACGVVPFDIELLDVQRMRAFAAHRPSDPRTASAYCQLAGQVALAHPNAQGWGASGREAGSVIPAVATVTSPALEGAPQQAVFGRQGPADPGAGRHGGQVAVGA